MRKLKISVTKGVPSGLPLVDTGMDFARVEVSDTAKKDPFFVFQALENELGIQLSDKTEVIDTETGRLVTFIPYDRKDKARIKTLKEQLDAKRLAAAADKLEQQAKHAQAEESA